AENLVKKFPRKENKENGNGSPAAKKRFSLPFGKKAEVVYLNAVDGVSLQIRQGEIFGLLGPNGAGKSTTIRMLCTLLEPTSGTARVNGYDVVREADQVRQHLGAVLTGERSIYWKLRSEERRVGKECH